MDPMSYECIECTRYGRTCVRQLHTKDERQYVLRGPAKVDAENESKQQMQSTRSRMVSAILITCDFVLI